MMHQEVQYPISVMIIIHNDTYLSAICPLSVQYLMKKASPHRAYNIFGSPTITKNTRRSGLLPTPAHMCAFGNKKTTTRLSRGTLTVARHVVCRRSYRQPKQAPQQVLLLVLPGESFLVPVPLSLALQRHSSGKQAMCQWSTLQLWARGSEIRRSCPIGFLGLSPPFFKMRLATRTTMPIGR